MKKRNNIEFWVESFLWNVRLFVIIPVFFSLLSVLILFAIGTEEILNGIFVQFKYSSDTTIYLKVIGHIIAGIDLYLIGIVLLIFGLGIYELFISKIDVDGQLKDNSNMVEIKSLDQLQERLLKTIIMVLVVTFFKQLITMEVETAKDLLYVGFSILMIAASSYLMHSSSAKNY